MNKEELIEALVRFTEQTGVEWESVCEDFESTGEFTVRFMNVEETEDE
jgi:hypothetical protein